jgi:hypothetical protein
MSPKGKLLSGITLITSKRFINFGDEEDHLFEL